MQNYGDSQSPIQWIILLTRLNFAGVMSDQSKSVAKAIAAICKSYGPIEVPNASN